MLLDKIGIRIKMSELETTMAFDNLGIVLPGDKISIYEHGEYKETHVVDKVVFGPHGQTTWYFDES